MVSSPEDGLHSSPKEGRGFHYTVFIRLPFARGEFVDPPPVSKNYYHTKIEIADGS